MKNLSEKEGELLACVELSANLAIDQIKEQTGLQEHAIRYHLHNLEEKGVIKHRPFINIIPIGYEYFGIYFSPATSDQNLKDGFLKKLLSEDKITWVAELGGDYSIGLALCVKNLSEVENVLESLSQKFSSIFFDKVIAGQFKATNFGRRYLSSKTRKPAVLEMVQTGKTIEIDDLDRRILAGMNKLEYRSHRQLGQIMGLPLSTMDDRIKRLEKSGIIAGYYYEVDPYKFGMQVATLLVSCKGLSLKIRETVRKFAEQNREVTFLYECLGSWDMELNVECTSLRELGALSDGLAAKLGASLNTIKVLSRYADLKNTFVPFQVGKLP